MARDLSVPRAIVSAGAFLAGAMLLLSPTSVTAKSHPPDWGKTCEKGPGGKEICYVMQTAIAKPQNVRVLQVVVGYLGKNGMPTMVLTTPLGVAVSAGVGIKIDDKKEMTVPFETCLPSGCRVVLAMDPSGFAGIKKAKEGKVRYATVDGHAIVVPVKFEGLSDALRKLKK